MADAFVRSPPPYAEHNDTGEHLVGWRIRGGQGKVAVLDAARPGPTVT
ncbi:hypothetical protein [Streptomyces sp. A1547]|nr:hypothetical protein [Streptomyces sp. A1547]